MTRLQRLPVWLWRVMAVAFIFYGAQRPVVVYANAGHDDYLFMHQAWRLLRDEWLGPFNEFTLMKGPGYGFFLFANAWAGLPVHIAHAVWHLLCVALFGYIISKFISSPWLRLFLGALLLWHPLYMSPRVIRDAVYAGQSLLVIGFWLAFLALRIRPYQRLALAALAGLTTSWFWLTREEGIWVVPGLLCLTAGCYALAERKMWRQYVAATVVALVAWASGIQAFAAANYVNYGKWVGVDVKERNFTSALSLLYHVSAGEEMDTFPVPSATREAVYAVSPTFARLKPYFEDSGRGWTVPVGPGSTERDYCAAIFIWSLRTAAAQAGAYESPDKASAFFGTMAAEIGDACASQKLTCQSSWVNLMPRLSPKQQRELLPTWARGMREMWTLQLFDPRKKEVNSGHVQDVMSVLNYPRIWPEPSAETLRPARVANKLRVWLTGFYQQLLPCLTLAAGAGIALVASKKMQIPRQLLYLALVGTTCLVTVITRIALLALTNAQFDAMIPQYLTPSYYLFTAGCVLLTYVGFRCAMALWTKGDFHA